VGLLARENPENPGVSLSIQMRLPPLFTGKPGCAMSGWSTFANCLQFIEIKNCNHYGYTNST
jgi:hypothetical protein